MSARLSIPAQAKSSPPAQKGKTPQRGTPVAKAGSPVKTGNSATTKTEKQREAENLGFKRPGEPELTQEEKLEKAKELTKHIEELLKKSDLQSKEILERLEAIERSLAKLKLSDEMKKLLAEWAQKNRETQEGRLRAEGKQKLAAIIGKGVEQGFKALGDALGAAMKALS